MQVPMCDEDNPTLGDIAKAVNQMHVCLDGVHGDVVQIRSDVGVVKDNQTTFDARLTAMAKRLGAEKLEKGDTDVSGRKLRPALLAWPGWKVIAALGALGGAMTGVVLAIQLFALPLAHAAVEVFSNIMAHQ